MLFFSGTIKTLTTAKAKLVYAQAGYVKDRIPLTGYLFFSDVEEIIADNLPEEISVFIKKIYVYKGSYVKKGDVLFETEMPGITEAIAMQEERYEEAEKSLLELEQQYEDLFLSHADRLWIDTYDKYISSVNKNYKAQIALEVEAGLQHIELIEGRIPDSIVDTDIISIQNMADQSLKEIEKAKSEMDKALKRGINKDAYEYTIQSRNYMNIKTSAYESLVKLRTVQESMKTVYAPHDGYILDVRLETGSQWDGVFPIMTISKEETDCYFQADISGISRKISVGSKVFIKSYLEEEIKSIVSNIEYDKYGNPIIYVPIEKENLAKINTMYSMLNNGVKIEVNYVSDQKTSLIPSSAIRWGKIGAYVYVPVDATDILGRSVYRLEIKPVSILDEANGFTAITGEWDGEAIIYMEDRAIDEKSEVIEYE